MADLPVVVAAVVGCFAVALLAGLVGWEASKWSVRRRDAWLASHCFREGNCADHPDHDGPLCCCCGLPAKEHTGCDCP